MDDNGLVTWVDAQRARVIAYLENHGICDPHVGEWPAFEVSPHFAIWAVESQKAPGKIGWWAFSGDCPTDYVSESGKCHPRSALADLLEAWRSYLPHMKEGRQPPNVSFGDGSNVKELGDLLESRVSILQEWLEDDELWEDRP